MEDSSALDCMGQGRAGQGCYQVSHAHLSVALAGSSLSGPGLQFHILSSSSLCSFDKLGTLLILSYKQVLIQKAAQTDRCV